MRILKRIFGRGKGKEKGPIQGGVYLTGSDRILSSSFYLDEDGLRQAEATEADLQGRPISQVIRIVEPGVEVGAISVEVRRVKGSQ